MGTFSLGSSILTIGGSVQVVVILAGRLEIWFAGSCLLRPINGGI